MVRGVMDAENPARRIMADDEPHLGGGHPDLHLVGVEPLGPSDALDMPARIVPERSFVPIIRQTAHGKAQEEWNRMRLRICF